MTPTGEERLTAHSSAPIEPIKKATDLTSAWFAQIEGVQVFAKLYPSETSSFLSDTERRIAGANLHPCIVPLVRTTRVSDGELFIYGRVEGDNLGDSDARARFLRLATKTRLDAVIQIVGALAGICENGWTVVDWYEGNMIYDFVSDRIWLFDWELCRSGSSFQLEMESNYGSSRLMAPEEFVRGTYIDEQTLVFNLGRFALLYLPDMAETLAVPIAKATYPSKTLRYKTVREFLAGLQSASH